MNDLENILEIENNIDMSLTNFLICLPEKNYVKCEKAVWVARYNYVDYEEWEDYTGYYHHRAYREFSTYVIDLLTGEYTKVNTIPENPNFKNDWVTFYSEKPFIVKIYIREEIHTSTRDNVYGPTIESGEIELFSVPVPYSIMEYMVKMYEYVFENWWVLENIDYIINKLLEVIKQSKLYEKVKINGKVIKRGDPEYDETIRKIVLHKVLQMLVRDCGERKICYDIATRLLKEIYGWDCC